MPTAAEGIGDGVCGTNHAGSEAGGGGFHQDDFSANHDDGDCHGYCDCSGNHWIFNMKGENYVKI